MILYRIKKALLSFLLKGGIFSESKRNKKLFQFAFIIHTNSILKFHFHIRISITLKGYII